MSNPNGHPATLDPYARLRTDIDVGRVEQLAYDGASNREIGLELDCGYETIRTRFPIELKRARAKRRLWLRALQFAKADEGNVTMLIWLGKQLLGQSDKVEKSEAGAPVERTIRYVNDWRNFRGHDPEGEPSPKPEPESFRED